MSDLAKATFSFIDFQIKSFSYKKGSTDQLSINLDPKGEFNSKLSQFIMTLEFTALEVLPGDKISKNVVAKANLEGVFKFENVSTLADIPSYFYKNGIAIIFPYLRAFLSNMTMQANIETLILPLYNLSNLEKILIKETIESK
jgi:preprotein translocase subunit SecB